MANKRMFSKQIIDSDAFLEMPLGTQALYFHLSMRADDDGFLNNAKQIMRLICANQNDYDLLLAKRFIIQFDDGICVIKHWRINNYLRKDRYRSTIYKDEKSKLRIKENGAYTLNQNKGLPLVYQDETKVLPGQPSIDKTREEENRLDKDSVDKTREENVSLSVFKHLEKCGIVITTRLDGSQYSRLLELIEADIELYGAQWVKDAADLAVTSGKYNLGYVEGILRNWKAEGREDKSKESKKTKFAPNPKTAGFNNFEPRDYDYDDLEKKLLGWDKDDEEGAV